MMISKEQHDAVLETLRAANAIYTSVDESQREKPQWSYPDNWKLGDPRPFNPEAFVPDETRGCYEANVGKRILWSRMINILIRENYTSVLDIGTGSGVFPAFLATTGITPYAIDPLAELVHTNGHWLEACGFDPAEHLFQADLSSFLESLLPGMGQKKPLLCVDCISWTGTLSGPENAEDWEKIESELTGLLIAAPWICRSLLISGDMSMGMMIEKVMKERDIDYAVTYKFVKSHHVSPGVQTDHYMLHFGKKAKGRKTVIVGDEHPIRTATGKLMVRPPNRYGFLTQTCSGEVVHPFPDVPRALREPTINLKSVPQSNEEQ